jgi:hypothetical protein
MWCPGEEKIWERVEVYIYPASMGTRDAGPIVIIRSGVSNAEVRDIRNHPGKTSPEEKPNRRRCG